MDELSAFRFDASTGAFLAKAPSSAPDKLRVLNLMERVESLEDRVIVLTEQLEILTKKSFKLTL